MFLVLKKKIISMDLGGSFHEMDGIFIMLENLH